MTPRQIDQWSDRQSGNSMAGRERPNAPVCGKTVANGRTTTTAASAGDCSFSGNPDRRSLRANRVGDSVPCILFVQPAAESA